MRPHPLGVLQKNSWSTNFENSEDSRKHDYYYYQFYLAASSHEIFLRVGGREGMKGLGALQKHQLPHLPCKNPGSATDMYSNRPPCPCDVTEAQVHLTFLNSTAHDHTCRQNMQDRIKVFFWGGAMACRHHSYGPPLKS